MMWTIIVDRVISTTVATTNVSSKLETEEKDEGISATALAVGAAVGVAALAAWGIVKWLGSSDPQPEQKIKMMKAPGRDGYMIPRSYFEESPETYFRNLRHKN
ncbi:hypothetical protein ACS0TY_008202 [Phlomoides rotata]